MRLNIVSDTHFEHYPVHKVQHMIDMLAGIRCEVIILAGDICTGRMLRYFLLEICRVAGPKKHVVYVPGNHEYYGSKLPEHFGVDSNMPENFHYLYRSSVTIRGRRFVGAVGWYRVPPNPDYINDADYIEKSQRIASWGLADQDYLRANVVPGDIVTTHYLPHPLSIAPQYEGRWGNRFFFSDFTDVIDNNKPRLFIHGHTHVACDYEVGETRVVCNPIGYPGENEKPKFNKIVSI